MSTRPQQLPAVILVISRQAVRADVEQASTIAACQVTTAAGADEAWLALAARSIALVIYEADEDVAGGLAFARAFRSRGFSLPLLLMTSVDARHAAAALGRERTAVDILQRGLPAELLAGRFAAHIDAQRACVALEEKLRASEQRCRLLAERIPELLWSANARGEIDLLGERWSLLDPSGAMTDWLSLLHANDRAETVRLWQEAVASGQPFDVECRLRGSDGTFRWFQVRAEPTRGQGGAVAQWLGSCVDIDRKKRSDNAAARKDVELRLIIDAVPNLVAYVDADQRFRFANQTYERWYQRPRADIMGKTLQDLLGQEAYRIARPWFERVMRGEAVQFEAAIAPAGLRPRHVQAQYLPDFDDNGGVRGFVVIVDDISGHKRIQHDLAGRARDLAETNVELEQFAYAASHDLQEPLRMVTQYLSLVQRRAGQALDDKTREYITFAMDGAQRMQRLIKDLLEYSRAGRLKISDEPVALGEVAAEAVRNLAMPISECDAKITVGALPSLRCDRTRMMQVFQNLIGNAIKFRKAGQQPTVDVTADVDGEAAVISVRDNGIGIDPAHFQRVFEVFQRLHTRADYPGTGIGLAICKRIVEQHGGRLWIESSPGVGSDFRFALRLD
jgi:PAS domain S-box-containing protein